MPLKKNDYHSTRDDVFILIPSELPLTPLLRGERGRVWAISEPVDSQFKFPWEANIRETVADKLLLSVLVSKKSCDFRSDFMWPNNSDRLLVKPSVMQLILEICNDAIVSKLVVPKNGPKHLWNESREDELWLVGAGTILELNIELTTKAKDSKGFSGMEGLEFTDEILADKAVVRRVAREPGQGYKILLNGKNIPNLFYVMPTNILCCSDQLREQIRLRKFSNVSFEEMGVFI